MIEENEKLCLLRARGKVMEHRAAIALPRVGESAGEV